MTRVAILALLLLASCVPVAGPNEQMLGAQGALQDTAAAERAMDSASQATAVALEQERQSNDQANRATVQAIEAVQTVSASNATATVQAAELVSIQATAAQVAGESTQGANIRYLTGLATLTAISAQATATAEIEARRADNWQTNVLLLQGAACAGSVMCLAFFGAVFYLVIRRLQAWVLQAEAKTRRDLTMATDGYLVWLGGAVPAIIRPLPALPERTSERIIDAEIIGGLGTPQEPQRRSPSPMALFLEAAIRAAGSRSTTIPRWERMEVNAGLWSANTHILEEADQVEILPNVGTRITGGRTLEDLYRLEIDGRLIDG